MDLRRLIDDNFVCNRVGETLSTTRYPARLFIMFSQTQEYALRAIIWLASHVEEGPLGNARIAEETDVSPSYLSKILQGLAEAGFISSKRGAGGGFQLLADPDELTVLEVLNAIDPIQRITTCPLGLKSHGTNLCPMHARLDESLKTVIDSLGTSTISELMSAPGRPTPLVETRRRKR